MNDQDTRNVIGWLRRAELTLAWMDLDRLLHADVGFSPLTTRNPHGVWRAWMWPQLRGVELKLGLAAHQALQMTSRSVVGRMGNMFSPRTVQSAKALTLTQLLMCSTASYGQRRAEA